jgi:hypothetical protein
MIIKVQKPLATYGMPPKALIYNEDRSVEIYVPMSKDMDELFGNDVKQYWEAKLGEHPGGEVYIGDGTTLLTLFKKLEEPNW